MEASGDRRVLALASIASLARPAVSADGRRVAVPLPVLSSTAWALQVLDVSGGPLTEIVSGSGHPIMPAWSPDGRRIYFSRADDQGVFGLWRIDAGGGVAQSDRPDHMGLEGADRNARAADTNGDAESVAARVRVIDAQGHPSLRDGAAGVARWSAWQRLHLCAHGGELQFEMPAGEYHIEATRGFEYHAAALGPERSRPGR